MTMTKRRTRKMKKMKRLKRYSLAVPGSSKWPISAACYRRLWEYLHAVHGLSLADADLEGIVKRVLESGLAIGWVQRAAAHGKPYISRGIPDENQQKMTWAFTLEVEAQQRWAWASAIPWGYGASIEEAAQDFMCQLAQAPLKVRRKLGYVGTGEE